jgi:hypothetical protein
MTDTLFDIPETLSPRLKWMRNHQIEVIDSGLDHEPGDKCEITGNRLYRFWAFQGGKQTKTEIAEAGGDTEDEAIVALAKKLAIPLWNEPIKMP